MDLDEKPKFSILIIDDEPDTLITDLAVAKGIVAEFGHEYAEYNDLDGKGAETILTEKFIDVIITDKNLIQDGENGIDVIKKIRVNNPFIDIIFYSGEGISKEEKEEVEKLHYVQVVDGKEISNELTSLIKKNMAKWDDISYLRGIVISLIVTLESQVHDFVLEYYQISEEESISFKTHILENRFFSFEGKKWALSKLIKSNAYPKLLEYLGDLQTARNNLAHSHLHETKKNCLKIKGSPEVIDKNKITEYYQKGKKSSEQLQKLIEFTKNKNAALKTE